MFLEIQLLHDPTKHTYTVWGEMQVLNVIAGGAC